MQQYAIIVAGGTGSRMNNTMPKQFLPIGNKPLLYYCINAFVKSFADINIIIVIHKQYIQNMQSVLQHFEPRINATIIEGGNTRYESVQNGLANVPNIENAIVYVHDAARPFITTAFLQYLQQDCIKYGNAIPALVATESMRIMTNETASEIIDRNNVRTIQTPQVFFATDIKKAFAMPYELAFTDEASVCEKNGTSIHISKGLDENIKITTPAQLAMADYLITNWKV